MNNVFTRKLQLFSDLSEDDVRLLDELVLSPRTIEANQDIIREGENPENVHLVVSGLAVRFKYLENGRRQIVAYLIPGDFCDVHIFILRSMDHTIATLAESQVVEIPRSRVLDLLARPNIARALWWATLVDEAILREWLVNLGQREALARIAHLFCELYLRMKAVGHANGRRFRLPITQIDLADTMGITPVHVNRVLQTLRESGLITMRAKEVVILDFEGLAHAGGFNPNYLHQEGGKRDRPS